MSEAPARTFTSDFKQFFVRGLAVLLPTVLTLWIIVMAYNFVQERIASPINGSVQWSLTHLARAWEPLDEFEPFRPTAASIEEARLEAGLAANDDSQDAEIIFALRLQLIRAWWESRWYLKLIGLVIALVIVYVTGRLVAGFLGRRLYRRTEVLITSLPVFKQVYPHVKQVVDFLLVDSKPFKVSRVVAAQYPRKGIWSVGFVTGPPLRSIQGESGEFVTLFIPSSPTPFTGYTITVPRSDVIDLPITVEEAIRYSVTAGVLVPDHQKVVADETRSTLGVDLPPGLAGQGATTGGGDDGEEEPCQTARDAG